MQSCMSFNMQSRISVVINAIAHVIQHAIAIAGIGCANDTGGLGGWVGGCCVCVRVCVYVYVVRLVGLCGGSRYWEVGLIARSCPLNVRGLARC